MSLLDILEGQIIDDAADVCNATSEYVLAVGPDKPRLYKQTCQGYQRKSLPTFLIFKDRANRKLFLKLDVFSFVLSRLRILILLKLLKRLLAKVKLPVDVKEAKIRTKKPITFSLADLAGLTGDLTLSDVDYDGEPLAKTNLIFLKVMADPITGTGADATVATTPIPVVVVAEYEASDLRSFTFKAILSNLSSTYSGITIPADSTISVKLFDVALDIDRIFPPFLLSDKFDFMNGFDNLLA